MVDLGLQLFTPDLLKSEMVQIDGAVDGLARDILATPLAQSEFGAQFGAWAKEWKEFYANNSGWFSRTLNRTADLIEGYKKRLNQWRNEFVKRGGQVTAPQLELVGKRPVLQTVAWIAGIVGAGILIYKFVGNRGKTVTFKTR